MSELGNLFPPIALAMVLTIVFIVALRPVASRIGLVDSPGGRKRHDGNVPLIGGAAMFVGMSFGVFLVTPGFDGILSLFFASVLLIIIGAIDDRFGLPATVRLATQVAVTLVMVYGAELQLSDIGDPFGAGIISMGRFSLIFTMLVTLTMINAYNLIDGIDGLAGGMALIALLSISVVAGSATFFGVAAMTISATIVAFLIFNIPAKWNLPAKTFMGDAGSLFLGFMLSVLPLFGFVRISNIPIYPLLIFSILFLFLIFDSSFVLLRRLFGGRRVLSCDLEHSYNIILRKIKSQRKTALFFYGINLLLVFASLAFFFILGS